MEAADGDDGDVGCGDGLRTGEADPLGDPSLRISVEDIVFLAACFARSVLTKLDTKSSRLPFKLGDARSSKGPTLIWVTEEPRAGDSRVEDVGDDTELL